MLSPQGRYIFVGSEMPLRVREEDENEPGAHQHSKPEKRRGMG
jgi:hypothetical protein